MSWLQAGPVALAVTEGASALRASTHLLRVDRPEPSTRVELTVRARFVESAGRPGPLERTPAGFLGPGFSVATGSSCVYDVSFADPISLEGALCAVLVDAGDAADAVLLHAAGLVVNGRAFLIAGPSGSGKSTFAARHRARAFASNAVLAWRDGVAWTCSGLPFTGHGDVEIRPGAFELLGGILIGRGATHGTFVALAAAVSTAAGGAFPLDRIERLASECSWRTRNVQKGLDPVAKPHSAARDSSEPLRPQKA